MAGAFVRKHIVLLGTGALLVLPVTIDLAASPRSRSFGYVAADTFYYLSVARNIARHGAPTFDGTHLVNGFHPLWQLLTAAIYGISGLLGITRQVVLLTVFASLALVTTGTLLLGLALREGPRRLTAGFLLFPVGLYGIVAAPAWIACLPNLAAQNALEGPQPLYGTLWSFVNGMESGLVLLFFGLAALLHERGRWRDSPSAAIALGAVLSSLVLSRLDHALLVFPIIASLILRTFRNAGSRSNGLRILLSSVSPVLLYASWSWIVFGSPIPTSGSSKSTFPNFTNDNINYIRALLTGPRAGEFLNLEWRALQLLVPAAVALIYLLSTVTVVVRSRVTFFRYRPSTRSFDLFLAPTAVGVLILAAYNLCFVLPYAQGHWYFPVSCVFVTLAPLMMISRLRWRAPTASKAWKVASACAFVAPSVWFFLVLHRQPEYHSRYSELYWTVASGVRAALGKTATKLIECDDGIVGFSLDFPTMSVDLMLDPEGVRARKAGRLYELARGRGFDSLSSLVYVSAIPLLRDGSARAAGEYAAQCLGGQGADRYHFRVSYVSPTGSFGIVREDVPEGSGASAS